MGLVVAIFAYLCSAAMLVVTLVMSFGALLYPPDQATIAQQTNQQTMAAAAKPRAAQSAQLSSTGNEPAGVPAAKEASADIPNSAARQPHVRRLARQVRAKDWLHQHEPRVFGYAEESSASFLYDRFQ